MDWSHLFKEYYSKVEAGVAGIQGDYKGTSFEALYTSPEDFTTIFTEVQKIGSFADLGAGMGQGCLIYASFFPNEKSTAVEFSKARVKAGQEIAALLKLSNIVFLDADLLTCPLPDADTYFLYFPTGPVLDRILHELHKKEKFQLIAIESHGDLFARLEKDLHLELIQEVTLKDQRYSQVARVFRKRIDLHSLSFLHRYLIVREDGGEEWIGESFGLEWSRGNQFTLALPPRSIDASQVKEVKELHEFPPGVVRVLKLRQEGSVRLQTKTSSQSGFIRKIFISPRFKLELSTGEQVEWSDITDISTETSCPKSS